MPDKVVFRNSGTLWAVRLIPLFIICAIGFATYDVVAYLCFQYLHSQKGHTGTAVALAVLYLFFLVLTLATYLRTFLTTQRDPAMVPLPPGREVVEKPPPQRRSRNRRDIEAVAYTPPDQNPDSPGLEQFYSRSVFTCEADGRPKWCSECRNWKPDRAHHSSELGRCIRKLDHVCPWVGGMVSETSFNFFVQFTFYCTLMCTVALSTGAYCLSLQQGDGDSLDGRTVAILVLAGFFGFFTFGMTATSSRYVFENITNIDMLRKSHVHQLAIRIPRHSTPIQGCQTIIYPLSAHQPWDQHRSGPDATSSPRDETAAHTFAIVRTEPDENPWDLGTWRNFKSVMGNNVFEWLLPIRHSPCCNHDSMVSDYEVGPLIQELRKRFHLLNESL
jgi:palmitoyltransferase